MGGQVRTTGVDTMAMVVMATEHTMMGMERAVAQAIMDLLLDLTMVVTATTLKQAKVLALAAKAAAGRMAGEVLAQLPCVTRQALQAGATATVVVRLMALLARGVVAAQMQDLEVAVVAAVAQGLAVDLEPAGHKVHQVDHMAALQEDQVKLVMVVATLHMEAVAVGAVAVVAAGHVVAGHVAVVHVAARLVVVAHVAVGHVAVVDAVQALDVVQVVDVVVADAVLASVVVADAVLLGAQALDAAEAAATLATVAVEAVVGVDVVAVLADAVKVDIHQTMVLVATAINSRAMLTKTHQHQ